MWHQILNFFFPTISVVPMAFKYIFFFDCSSFSNGVQVQNKPDEDGRGRKPHIKEPWNHLLGPQVPLFLICGPKQKVSSLLTPVCGSVFYPLSENAKRQPTTYLVFRTRLGIWWSIQGIRFNRFVCVIGRGVVRVESCVRCGHGGGCRDGCDTPVELFLQLFGEGVDVEVVDG